MGAMRWGVNLGPGRVSVQGGSASNLGTQQLAAARFVGNAQGAQMPVVLGGVGAINYEIQALVLIEGARNSQARIFMTQFPAGRQCGLFARNVAPFDLATGDSQTGTVGGEIGSNPNPGTWCLLTFSADGNPTPTGQWQGSMQALDGSQPYSQGGRAKGVEDSLQVNRVDLNGGAAEFGWTNGIRFAEVRAYNAQRTPAQRAADLTNLNPAGAVFWWRFQDDGAGGLSVIDRTGNGLVPTTLIGTLAVGPAV